MSNTHPITILDMRLKRETKNCGTVPQYKFTKVQKGFYCSPLKVETETTFWVSEVGYTETTMGWEWGGGSSRSQLSKFCNKVLPYLTFTGLR